MEAGFVENFNSQTNENYFNLLEFFCLFLFFMALGSELSIILWWNVANYNCNLSANPFLKFGAIIDDQSTG